MNRFIIPMNRHSSFENALKIADFIQKQTTIKPLIGIITGSGLSTLTDLVTSKFSLRYKDIPGFPVTSVSGHPGNLVFGYIASKPVVVMQGRFHQYEGLQLDQIALPIRVLKLLGVNILLITNAVGGLKADQKLGNLVLVKDHLSMAILTPNNPLVGPNDGRFGPRFPVMEDAYCPKLKRQMEQIVEELGHTDRVYEGVYFHIVGPAYTTLAENRMMVLLGADVVGMSLVPEVLVARHCDIKVLALSLITDMSVPGVCSSVNLTHEDVLQIAEENAKFLGIIIEEFIRRL